MRIAKLLVVAHAALAVSLNAGNAQAAATYFIDEVINYSAACSAPTLVDDTSILKSRMDAASWTGARFVDGDAWATDFRESCSTIYGSSGQDNLYADSKALTVFSGHGATSTLMFGVAQNTCSLNIDSQARLGSMGGAGAAVGMYISAFTLDLNSSGAPISGGNQWLRQQLGFHGIVAALGGTRYGNFFDDTSAKANSQAWLDRFADQPASVVSYANGSGDCWNVASSAKLKGGVYRTPRSSGPACGGGQPLYTWCSQWAGAL